MAARAVEVKNRVWEMVCLFSIHTNHDIQKTL